MPSPRIQAKAVNVHYIVSCCLLTLQLSWADISEEFLNSYSFEFLRRVKWEYFLFLISHLNAFEKQFIIFFSKINQDLQVRY